MKAHVLKHTACAHNEIAVLPPVNHSTCAKAHRVWQRLKLLSQPWLILIPKIKQIKINNSISQIISINVLLLRIALKFLGVFKKCKQISAFSGPGRISRFINIKEFPSPCTLLDHSFPFSGQF